MLSEEEQEIIIRELFARFAALYPEDQAHEQSNGQNGQGKSLSPSQVMLAAEKNESVDAFTTGARGLSFRGVAAICVALHVPVDEAEAAIDAVQELHDTSESLYYLNEASFAVFMQQLSEVLPHLFVREVIPLLHALRARAELMQSISRRRALRKIFLAYSKRITDRSPFGKWDQGGYSRASSGLLEAEFLKFARDFDLLPSQIGMLECVETFRKFSQTPPADLSPGSLKNAPALLDFDGFLDGLVELSFRGFPSGSAQSRVRSLLRRMECSTVGMSNVITHNERFTLL